MRWFFVERIGRWLRFFFELLDLILKLSDTSAHLVVTHRLLCHDLIELIVHVLEVTQLHFKFDDA